MRFKMERVRLNPRGHARRGGFAAAIASGVALLAAPSSAVENAALASDNVPAAILEACETNADPSGAFEPAVAAAIGDLDALGVFIGEDFAEVRIGFCALRAHQGPVATTACARDVILVDEKYAGADQRPLLRATLAHEMKHVAQHRERRARLGAAWCDSDAYRAERPTLEAEAETFGDAVSTLFYVGRKIEITNSCPVAVRVYLEGDGVFAANAKKPPAFFSAPAGASVEAPAASMSRRILYYAESAASGGKRWVWRDKRGPDPRFIEGRTVGLKRRTLPAPGDASTPFRLVLRCSKS